MLHAILVHSRPWDGFSSTSFFAGSERFNVEMRSRRGCAGTVFSGAARPLEIRPMRWPLERVRRACRCLRVGERSWGAGAAPALLRPARDGIRTPLSYPNAPRIG